MTYQFDSETAVRTVGTGSDGQYQFETHIEPHWNIGTNPNGGYLLAPLLRAMSEIADQNDPITVTSHFLRPGSGGTDASIDATVIRAGRGYSTLDARLVQEGRDRVVARAAFGSVGDPPDDTHRITMEPPAMPGPDQCAHRSGDAQGVDLPLLSRVEMRLDTSGSSTGHGAPPAVVQGYLRFADGRPPDLLSLPLFCDAFPPPIFNRLGMVGWVPTLELTVHVRRRPAAGWLRGRFECTDLADGRMIEDGHLWDSNGDLVAQSRQVALLLTH